jgi:hypothetical protein
MEHEIIQITRIKKFRNKFPPSIKQRISSPLNFWVILRKSFLLYIPPSRFSILIQYHSKYFFKSFNYTFTNWERDVYCNVLIAFNLLLILHMLSFSNLNANNDHIYQVFWIKRLTRNGSEQAYIFDIDWFCFKGEHYLYISRGRVPFFPLTLFRPGYEN